MKQHCHGYTISKQQRNCAMPPLASAYHAVAVSAPLQNVMLMDLVGDPSPTSGGPRLLQNDGPIPKGANRLKINAPCLLLGCWSGIGVWLGAGTIGLCLRRMYQNFRSCTFPVKTGKWTTSGDSISTSLWMLSPGVSDSPPDICFCALMHSQNINKSHELKKNTSG